MNNVGMSVIVWMCPHFSVTVNMVNADIITVVSVLSSVIKIHA